MTSLNQAAVLRRVYNKNETKYSKTKTKNNKIVEFLFYF